MVEDIAAETPIDGKTFEVTVTESRTIAKLGLVEYHFRGGTSRSIADDLAALAKQHELTDVRVSGSLEIVELLTAAGLKVEIVEHAEDAPVERLRA